MLNPNLIIANNIDSLYGSHSKMEMPRIIEEIEGRKLPFAEWKDVNDYIEKNYWWISVDDRLPEISGSYMVYTDLWCTYTHIFDMEKWWGDNDYWCVTHWMGIVEWEKLFRVNF